MSISPNDAQRSQLSSDLDPLQNPSSHDGIADRDPRGPFDSRQHGDGSAREAAAKGKGVEAREISG